MAKRLEADLHSSQKRAVAAENNIEGLEAQLAEARRKIQTLQREVQTLKTSVESYRDTDSKLQQFNARMTEKENQ